MVGGGNLDFYTAVAPIYPLLGVALLVESRLSAQTAEVLPRQTRDKPWGPDEWRAFRWRVVPVMVGLMFGVVGIFAALRVLVEGHATRREFWVADIALSAEAAALVVLLIYHVWEMVFQPTNRQRVKWVGVVIMVGLVGVFGYGVSHP